MASNGVTCDFWRSRDHDDWHAIDAGVMVTMDMVHGPWSWATSDDLKVDYYSNNGSGTSLPVCEVPGD